MYRNSKRNTQPCAVIVAGDLVSHVYRRPDHTKGQVYSFNLFRLSHDSQALHSFRPEDLRDVVKACQVLAFAIVDDAWLPDAISQELNELASELDEVTQKWRGSNEQ